MCVCFPGQQIAQSLQSILDYEEEEEDFQDTFMATFQVSFSDMFDDLQTFDLREGGDKIPVTLKNRQVSMRTECMRAGTVTLRLINL